MLATVTDKGQLTVPKAIREQFGIQPGSKLDFEVMADGTLRVRVLNRGSSGLLGLLRFPVQPARSLEQMEDGISEAVSRRLKRAARSP